MDKFRGRQIGWGPWRRNWYSICSRHFDEDCRRCMTGYYVWRVPRFFGSLIYRFCPRLWRWWANRPNSKARRRFESVFPGLKGKNGE